MLIKVNSPPDSRETRMDLNDQAPDFDLTVSPGATRKLADFGPGPYLLIFLRHLA